ncbi:S-layer homology domain-containing protein [Bacillus sp. CGMCC 1.16607]|uniref:S-layer homology domain-containing protein n=1 Tax=Bacillus sp. CGMCC 1.16607 TaxID=3351842 RepID=UPI0036438125
MLNWRKFIVTGALATTLTFSSISAMAVSFDDLSGSEGEMAIHKLVSLGIIVDKDTYFNPEAGLSRLEFAEITSRIVPLSAAKVVKIKDVNTTKGQNAAVLKVLNTGLLSLNKNGEYKPKSNITQGELAKALAYGLGFKKAWSNRPIDYLFYLERKGVLDIDTDLDAAVTREQAAVAIDKYMLVKEGYKTKKGIVSGLTATGFSLKNESGVVSYKLAANASIFLDAQQGEKDNLAAGTEIQILFNSKNEVAFVSGDGLELVDGKLGYVGGNLTFNDAAKKFNLNAIVQNLPNNPTTAFTFTEFSNYAAKADVKFEGALYSSTVTDEVTMLEPYITKIEKFKPAKIAGDTVTFDFSGFALKNQTFKFAEDAKFNIVETVKDEATGKSEDKLKEATLADIVALQSAGKVITANLEAGADGTAKVLSVKAEEPKK